MAKASLSAQHYLECDNCEENPAKFLCKTCTGHLCEACKSKHERKKITRNHEILPLTSKNEEMLDTLLCPKHTKKKLDCYCDRCREPVCTECIVQSHNGHSVKTLFTVYKDFIDDSKQKKEKIDTVILPKHREVLAKEREMRSAFREKADGIQKEIDAYTQRMVDQVKQFGKETVVSLRKAEEDGLKEMDKFKVHIEKKINELQSLSAHISANIEAKPQFSMFESINSIDLKSYQTLPNSVEFKLTDFQPQRRRFENMFGEPPVLKIEYKKKSSLSQRNAIKAFDLTTGNWLPSMDNINSDSSDEDVISIPSFKPLSHPEILSDHSNSNSSDSDGVTVPSPSRWGYNYPKVPGSWRIVQRNPEKNRKKGKSVPLPRK